MPHGPKDVALDFLVAAADSFQHLFDLRPSRASGAGAWIFHHREIHLGGEALQERFVGKGQRADHGQTAFKKRLAGEHGAHFSGIEDIEEQGFDQIVLVVPQSQLVASQLPGHLEHPLPSFSGA